MTQPRTNRSGLFRVWNFATKTLPDGRLDRRVWAGKVLDVGRRLVPGSKVLLRNSENETTVVIYDGQFSYE